MATLPVGAHVITARIQDSGGKFVTVIRNITIVVPGNNQPVITSSDNDTLGVMFRQTVNASQQQSYYRFSMDSERARRRLTKERWLRFFGQGDKWISARAQ